MNAAPTVAPTTLDRSSRTLVIWNAGAGGAAGADEVRNALSRRERYTLVEASSAEQTIDEAAAAVERGFAMVVAAGGDGTASAVANGLLAALADDDVPPPTLALLPLGTGNDLCRTLAVPLDPVQALNLLDAPVVRRVDAVEVRAGGRKGYYVNMATAGYSGRVVGSLETETKRRWGPLAYLRQAADLVTDRVSYRARLRLDGGEPFEHSLFNLVLGNGRTSAGGLMVAPRANPEDGLIDVVMVLDGSLLDLATLAARLLVGDYVDSEQVLLRRARKVEVEAEPPFLFSADGDIVAHGAASFDVLPQALPMVVGPDYSAEPPV